MDPVAVIRSRAYLSALVLAAILGIPISAIAYGFLTLVQKLQTYFFTTLPGDLFTGGTPAWWPIPFLAVAGLLVGATIRYLPGNAGHSPALGFVGGGSTPVDKELPGIILASFATLSLGVVLGPEAPLIAIGGGLAALVVHQLQKDAPPMALTIMASAGSFAAISTLLGSPILGAFLIMEVAGVGGVTLSLVALPGLLAAGVGAVVFVGLDNWTGYGTFSLALTSVPPVGSPTGALLLWALVFGVGGALVGWVIRWISLSIRPQVHRSRIPVSIALGVLIGVVAMLYQLISNRSATEVLFSGQDSLPTIVAHVSEFSVGTLILLGVCKMLMYALSLSAFRGGPIFPAMIVGAAAGMAMAGLPGMSLGPGLAMGIGAMCVAMLRLPMTSALLAVLLLGSQGSDVTPEVIVAVAVGFVVTTVLPAAGPPQSEPAEATPDGPAVPATT
jgi:H+/Cl- antiporter ClcA